MPVASLSEGGVAPEEGDSVSYSVDGTVQSVSGNQATVKIDAVNGEPVSEEGAETPEEEGAEPETGTPPVAASGGMRPQSPGLAALGAKLRKGAKANTMFGP